MAKSCPACLKETQGTLIESIEDLSIYRCPLCGLQYVDPLPSHIPVFEDFTDGGIALFMALDRGEAIESFLTPNERFVLRWVKRHVSLSASVLELCCESGRFIAALKKHGFNPIGMDPLSRPVDMLKEKGFVVQVGFIEDYCKDWPEPSCVVLLESLVRFPEPVAFLKSIRQRFPKAALCLSIPSPRRSLKVPEFERRLDYPPHHLTRWTGRALLTALTNAGYQGRCFTASVDIHWRRGSWRSRILKIFFALFLRICGESEYSIIVIARPADN